MAEFGLTGAMLECHKLLIRLKKHQYAWPFNQPVDPVALNIPTYFDIIKEPMDLGTIQEKLEAREYTNPEEFIRDVELVWGNARTFNPPDHDICKMAATLSKIFAKGVPKIHQLWQKIPTSPATPSSSLPKISPISRSPGGGQTKAEMAETINELRDSMRHVKAEIERLRKDQSKESLQTPQPPAQPPVRKVSKKVEPVLRDMSYEEKQALGENINQLSSEHLVELVRIIEKGMPNLKMSTDNSIEVDIDLLDTATLRECEKFVRSVLPKGSKKRKAITGAKIPKPAQRGPILATQAPQNESRDTNSNAQKDSSSSSSSSDSSSSDSSSSEDESKPKKSKIELDTNHLEGLTLEELKERVTKLEEENKKLKADYKVLQQKYEILEKTIG